MKKQISMLLVLLMILSLFAGCGAKKEAAESSEEASEVSSEEVSEEESSEESSEEAEMTDEEAAQMVADLIDAIYVQTRTEETDAQCEAAKAAWDALTDEQKAMVEGVNADPDYFGLDTGDASLDDPLNQDIDNENEILVVSFGTSFNTSRTQDIGGIEKAIAAANPDWAVRRAFTSQIIINHIQARDGEKIDNMDQAMERAIGAGVKNLVIQPTHLMHGAEYDELKKVADANADQFESIIIAEPLLGPVGEDATVINSDKETVAAAVVAEAASDAGFKDAAEAESEGVAFVLMGHGTSHTAKISYTQMQTQMNTLGYDNVFIGTVEGEPEETACENIIEAVHEKGYQKVFLRPLMVVAGDHANNDMAGEDEDSWKSLFEASGYFTGVEAQIEGLGSVEAIQQLYVAHTAAALMGGASSVEPVELVGAGESLEDGVYTADFTTDSGMFHVNEMMDGKGTLTVKDGQMMIHIVLTSTNIINLYLGSAAGAEADEANWLQPTVETVDYGDGTTEEVNAFDVPVAAIGADFDLALLGTKGTWYDHVVSVSNPEAAE